MTNATTAAKKAPASKAAPAKKAPAARKAAPARVAAPTAPAAPAGWYQDPEDEAQERYWDGKHWLDTRVPETAEDGESKAAAAGRPTAEIEFRGMKMGVQFPSPEQLGAWQRIGAWFKRVDPDPEKWTPAQQKEFAKQLPRIIVIIQSVLLDPDDKDYILDQMLDTDEDGKALLSYTEGGTIINKAMDAFEGQGTNRAARRAKPKASRV